MIDPKVVPFQQGADFLRARGMKLKRSGQWLDALDLLRRAAETDPDGADHRLDIADVYAEMGCHHDSRAMTVMHAMSRQQDADAYYRMAKCAVELGALNEAEKAYEQFLRMAGEDERADEVRGELEDIRTAYGMWRQIDRNTRRKVRHLREVRRRQVQRDFAGAERIYERELTANPNDYQMRANRAMNLCMQGEFDAVRAELAQIPMAALRDSIPSLIILVAQAYHRIGEDGMCDQVLNLLDRSRMSAQDHLMMMALQADLGRNEAAYASGGEALRQQPYDRRMLHLMAVTAARMGRSEREVGNYWQRILRIDPEDDIAQWHVAQLRAGTLTPDMLYDAYQLPPQEALRRSRRLLEMLNMPHEAVREMWNTDIDAVRVLHWALFSEKSALVNPAMQQLAFIGTPQSMRYIAEFIARTHMDDEVKIQAAQILGALEPDKWSGVGQYMQMQLIPGYQEVLQGLPVSRRQMVRMAKDVLELDYQLHADLALALQCANHMDAVAGGFDRMLDLHAGAGALVLIELRAAGRDVDVRDLAKKCGSTARKIQYYAKYLNDLVTERE